MSLGLRNCNAQLRLLPLIQGSLHSLVLLKLLTGSPTCSVPTPQLGPSRLGWGSSGSLKDSILFLCGAISASRQTTTCPSCTIFISYGFPVGTQSSLQGLWVGGYGQGRWETLWLFLSGSLIQWNSGLALEKLRGSEWRTLHPPSHRARLGSWPPWT